MFRRSIRAPLTPREAPASVLGKKGMTPSVLSADLHVQGNLVSEGVLDINGKVEGNIRCHTAIIRGQGRVRGDILAEIVQVYGGVEGTIKSKTVALHGGAHVVGTILHEALTIADGAFVDGSCKRTDKVFLDEEGEEIRPHLALPAVVDEVFGFAHDEPVSAEEIQLLENLRLVR